MKMHSPADELSVIQKTYDLVKWWVPILNRLPKDHKFNLGDRIDFGRRVIRQQSGSWPEFCSLAAMPANPLGGINGFG